MSDPYRRKGSRFYWIAPVVDGVQRPQSSGTSDYDEARRMLREIEGDIARGIPVGPKIPMFRELCEEVRRDYKIKGRSSHYDLGKRLDLHILPALGHIQAARLSESEIAAYILQRKNAGAKPATINRELAVIKRAFSLNRRKVPNPPKIEMLPEDNTRETSYSDSQLLSILNHANPLLRDVLTVYAYTGWRKSSVLKMEWPQVDLAGGWVYLLAHQTKNRKATKFPLITGLKEVFEERRRETDAIQKRTRKIIPYVFHRNGKPIKSIRTAFTNARSRAGLPGHVIHDFRRTAVRALRQAGYDLKAIMDLCGFRTPVMVLRYLGMTPDDVLLSGMKELEARRIGTTVGRKVRGAGSSD